MEQAATKKDIFLALQRQVLSMQGNTVLHNISDGKIAIGPIEQAFPGNTFPVGVIHEFISKTKPSAAATNGFIAGILGQLMNLNGACLWISTKRTIFPPALKAFGIAPERILFVDVVSETDALWVVEEALKCAALAAVVGEFTELSFTHSRRLQLAVEKSRVTGFIHRYNPRTQNTTACVTRWEITPLPGTLSNEEMPGLGFPFWNVQLLKVRNGQPGVWQVGWSGGAFRELIQPSAKLHHLLTRKAV